MRKRYSQTRLQPIGDILHAALKKKGMAFRLEENAVIKLWPKAVGAKIAGQTHPESIRAGTLFVQAASSVWVQQLHFMKEDIKNKINELAGKPAVKDIHFKAGYRPSRAAGQSVAGPTKRTVLRDRDKKMIAECTDKLADRELAAIVKRVMKMEISRRRHLEEKKTRL